MDKHCYVEVDVNGEEVFMVDKSVISSYSGRIKNLFSKSKVGVNRRLKLIFHDFPGGPSNFELVTRFCYNRGKTTINPLYISNLTCAAHYMEMNESCTKTENLCELAAKSIQEIDFWTWAELLVALTQCQNLLPSPIALVMLDKFLDSLVTRIASSYETSPRASTSSPDSSEFRFSCDTRSSESLNNNFPFRPTWWFDDLAALDARVMEKMVRIMVSRDFDNGVISKFLFFFQKSRFRPASPDEKIGIFTLVVDLLFCLDVNHVSHKSLFELLRVGLKMNLSQRCKNKLDRMIGSLLDRATLDNLLIPAPARKSYIYDVNLVVRFLRSFLGKGVSCVASSRLEKVARLIDLYLAEISPDPHLKPSKFLAVIKALPESARESYDGVYHAVNLYLEVHSSLSEEKKMKICSSGLNYEKLSTSTFNHLIQNANFPEKSATQALVSRQRIQESRKNVVYEKRLNPSDENMKAHLQGMQWRVLELEKVCREMQFEMAKMTTKSRFSSHKSHATFLPKLCS